MAEQQFHTEPNPAEAAHILHGIDFPADKTKILQYAKDHQAPDDLMAILKEMPEAQYTSMADVFQGFGRVR